MTETEQSNIAKKELLRLCSPVFLETLCVSAMGNLANLLLNRFSADALTATSACGQAYTLIGYVFSMVATGGSILLAPAFGGKRKKDALEITIVMLFYTILSGLLLGGACIILMPRILELLNLPGELIGMGREYLTVLLGCCVLSGIQTVLTAIFRSMGRMTLVMINNILQYVIICSWFLGILNLVPQEQQSIWHYAMATILSQLVVILVMLIALKRDGFFHAAGVDRSIWAMLYKWSARLLHLGIRAGFAPVIGTVVQIYIVRFMGKLGVFSMTARAYAASLIPYMGIVNSTIITACAPLFGTYIGSGKIQELPGLVRRTMRIDLLLTGIGCLGIVAFGYPLLRGFTDDALLLRVAFQVLLVDAASKLIAAFTAPAASLLKAAGDVQFPFAVSLIAYAVNLVTSYLFGIRLRMGLVGIWLGFVAAEILNGGMAVWRFQSGKWKQFFERGLFE